MCRLLATFQRNSSVFSASAPNPARSFMNNPGYANFHEKALFVKADVAAPRGRAQRLCVLRYASIRTLDEPMLFGDSVHCEIHLFGLLSEGAAIFGSVSPAPLRRVDQVRNLRSRLML